MKKVFRTLFFAIAVMGLATACNNNAPVEEEADTLPVVVEDTVVVDTAATVEEVAEVIPEEPVKKTATKTAAKKEEKKPTNVSVTKEDGVTITTGGTSIKMKKSDDGKLAGETTITTKDGTTIHTNNLGKMGKK